MSISTVLCFENSDKLTDNDKCSLLTQIFKITLNSSKASTRCKNNMLTALAF